MYQDDTGKLTIEKKELIEMFHEKFELIFSAQFSGSQNDDGNASFYFNIVHKRFKKSVGSLSDSYNKSNGAYFMITVDPKKIKDKIPKKIEKELEYEYDADSAIYYYDEPATLQWFFRDVYDMMKALLALTFSKTDLIATDISMDMWDATIIDSVDYTRLVDEDDE